MIPVLYTLGVALGGAIVGHCVTALMRDQAEESKKEWACTLPHVEVNMPAMEKEPEPERPKVGDVNEHGAKWTGSGWSYAGVQP